MRATELAEAVRLGHVSLDVALRDHLQHDLYPPVGGLLVGMAHAALDAYAEGDTERLLLHPTTGYRMPAHEVVDRLHLEAFVSLALDDDDEHFWPQRR
jgi:hypothetical protein